MTAKTVLSTIAELHEAVHDANLFFVCCDCGQTKSVQHHPHGAIGTGYGYDNRGLPVCYECCGKNDLKDMLETGRAILYLSCEPASKMKTGRLTKGEVSNWPGTLKLPCHTRVGRHNIAGHRYDCWFVLDGWEWHGVTYGDNTQICHCRRTKKKGV